MSYLILKNGVPGFAKAVISFWFIAPTKSIRKVAQLADDGQARRMRNILPLLTFGELFDGYAVDTISAGQGQYNISFYLYDLAGANYQFLRTEAHTYGLGPQLSEGEPSPVDSSYIGVDCNLDEEAENGLSAELRIRIQMAQIGAASQTDMVRRFSISNGSQLVNAISPDQDTAYSNAAQDCITGSVYPGGTQTQRATSVDYSALVRGKKGPDAFEAGAGLKITPDKWHHLLLSFDLSTAASASGGTIFDKYECSPTPTRIKTDPQVHSTCQMWIALDDKNQDNTKTPRPLGSPAYAYSDDPFFSGLGTNGILTEDGYSMAFTYNGGLYAKAFQVSGMVTVTDFPADAGAPQFTYHPHNVPSGAPFGFPCVPTAIGHEYHNVELAEFQMWTGLVLDTSVEGNRRAFIDREKDAEGEPISDFKSVPPSTAEKLMNRRPDILLHGTGNWKQGKNTGILGVDETGKEKPGGQFVPTGEIKAFTPDPELEKPA